VVLGHCLDDSPVLSFPPMILRGDFSTRYHVLFQNVNRLRSKTSDLFRFVLLVGDYDVVVLLEMNLVSSFYDKDLFDDEYLVFKVRQKIRRWSL
jgi:hypothetical protein